MVKATSLVQEKFQLKANVNEAKRNTAMTQASSVETFQISIGSLKQTIVICIIFGPRLIHESLP